MVGVAIVFEPWADIREKIYFVSYHNLPYGGLGNRGMDGACHQFHILGGPIK